MIGANAEATNREQLDRGRGVIPSSQKIRKNSAHFWCGLEYTFRNASFATDSNGMVLVDLLHKLILRHGFGRVIYLPALVLESSESLRADILKKEEFEVLVFYGVKDFW